jgi:hypothetical protein
MGTRRSAYHDALTRPPGTEKIRRLIRLET